MKKALFSSILALFSLVAIAGGNVTSTSLEGKVVDDEGNPVMGAKVVLMESNKEVFTDFDGIFRFEKVATTVQKLKVHFIAHEDLISEVNLAMENERQVELQLDSK